MNIDTLKRTIGADKMGVFWVDHCYIMASAFIDAAFKNQEKEKDKYIRIEELVNALINLYEDLDEKLTLAVLHLEESGDLTSADYATCYRDFVLDQIEEEALQWSTVDFEIEGERVDTKIHNCICSGIRKYLKTTINDIRNTLIGYQPEVMKFIKYQRVNEGNFVSL